MAHRYRRNTVDTVTGVFSLNPMPYPVLLLLGVIFFFLGLQWYVSYESMVETTEENMGWILLAVPLVLILAVKLLSTMESPGRFFSAPTPWDRHRRMQYQYSEGSPPWGVAALILLLLVLVQFQSSFLDRWFFFS